MLNVFSGRAVYLSHRASCGRLGGVADDIWYPVMIVPRSAASTMSIHGAASDPRILGMRRLRVTTAARDPPRRRYTTTRASASRTARRRSDTHSCSDVPSTHCRSATTRFTRWYVSADSRAPSIAPRYVSPRSFIGTIASIRGSKGAVAIRSTMAMISDSSTMRPVPMISRIRASAGWGLGGSSGIIRRRGGRSGRSGGPPRRSAAPRRPPPAGRASAAPAVSLPAGPPRCRSCGPPRRPRRRAGR